jgi:hypothetical protein
VVIAWPLGTWAAVTKAGLPAQPVMLAAMVSLFACDRFFKFRRCCPS